MSPLASPKLFAKTTGIETEGLVNECGILKTLPIKNATAIVSPNALPKERITEPMIPTFA